MPAAAVVGGAALVGGIYSARQQSKAANNAANAQSASAQAGIDEQQRQFDAIQQLLSPYVQAGTGALGAQQNLAGLNGDVAQAQAINGIERSAGFQSLLSQGENSLLQNASATGGLRGGNTQGALAQFSPALLSAAVNDQYSRLGGISSMGLGAATQTGSFGQAATNNVTNLLQQQGAARAGGALAQGQAQAQMINSITNGIGMYSGFGGRF